jgi:hypothetical protein
MSAFSYTWARLALVVALLSIAVANYGLFLYLALPVSSVLILPAPAGLLGAGVVLAVHQDRIREAANGDRAVWWVPTPLDDLRAMLKAAGAMKAGGTFLDLGSGDARTLQFAIQDAGFEHAFGMESSISLHTIARLRLVLTGLQDACTLRHGDFVVDKLPTRMPSVIYIYLTDRSKVDAIAARLPCLYRANDTEGKQTPTVLTRGFPLKGFGRPHRTIERGGTTLYVYTPESFPKDCGIFF